MRQQCTGVPVHYRKKKHMATIQRNVGDVGTPHLVWPVYCNSLQTVRIYAGPSSRNCRTFSRVNGLYAHSSHQTFYSFSANTPSSGTAEQFAHPASSCPRILEMELVDKIHQQLIFCRFPFRLVVDHGSRHIQQSALVPYAQLGLGC